MSENQLLSFFHGIPTWAVRMAVLLHQVRNSWHHISPAIVFFMWSMGFFNESWNE